PQLLLPDMWILMGALAIATLSGAHIAFAGIEGIRPVTIATWLVATLWIPPLVYVGLRCIQRYPAAAVWWAAVFPLGMYSAATFAVATETGLRLLKAVSLVFFWVAFAAWILVALRAVRDIALRSRG